MKLLTPTWSERFLSSQTSTTTSSQAHPAVRPWQTEPSSIAISSPTNSSGMFRTHGESNRISPSHLVCGTQFCKRLMRRVGSRLPQPSIHTLGFCRESPQHRRGRSMNQTCSSLQQALTRTNRVSGRNQRTTSLLGSLLLTRSEEH